MCMYVFQRVRQPSGVFNAVTMSKTINALYFVCSRPHVRTAGTKKGKKQGVLVWKRNKVRNDGNILYACFDRTVRIAVSYEICMGHDVYLYLLKQNKKDIKHWMRREECASCVRLCVSDSCDCLAVVRAKENLYINLTFLILN